MRSLIIGATSEYGKPIALALEKAGYQIRIFTENYTKARIQFPNHYEFLFGNIENVEEIQKALHNCDHVHINIAGGPSPSSYFRYEHMDTSRIAQIAAKQGVRRLTYLSSAYIKHANFNNPSIKSKFLAEQAIRNSRVPYTIFRTTWLMEFLPQLAKDHTSNIPTNLSAPIYWLAADDLGDMIVKSLQNSNTVNNTFTVGGKTAHTLDQAFQLYQKHVDHNFSHQKFSNWLIKLNSLFHINQAKRDQYRNLLIDLNTPNYEKQTANSFLTLGNPQIKLEDWCKFKKNPWQVSA